MSDTVTLSHTYTVPRKMVKGNYEADLTVTLTERQERLLFLAIGRRLLDKNPRELKSLIDEVFDET